MSAAEDDTELRDLLIQNLENSGVLNKLKAEMRAAVFLAMEEQDRLENKSPLVNENLKKCLNTKDGRLVASLIMDFLQVFNLDFTLAVFQPEINSLNGLDSRDLVCRDLGLSESEVNRNSPVLLELVRRGRHKATETDRSGNICKAAEDSAVPEEKMSSPPVSKDSERESSLGKGDFQQQVSRPGEASHSRTCSSGLKKDGVDLDLEDEPDEGDSFFDDPLPKPQKTYGCLSVLAADSEGKRDDPLSERSQTSELRKVETSRPRESPAGSLSEAQRPGGRGGGGGGGSSVSEQSHSRNGASNSRERDFRDSKAPNDKTGSLHLDDDVEYDDDFNSHRSDLSKSELSIGEEIEEVSIEGPDNSDKLDETTQDLSVSQLSQSHGVDYMEEVA
ncbi:FGFR1 oncogene partner isoform X2 [Morone saxatilis]|uniref:FGFR1 oncogene partner isoform X2 n=1 Tax=Morone saxatilis TaxID=34816 RepID=UPI0015E1C59E|nr:FGFR1 oncogene partner isoform X2 [Morone saxatilis]